MAWASSVRLPGADALGRPPPRVRSGAAEVLHERVSSTDHSCRAESFQAAHRPQPRLQRDCCIEAKASLPAHENGKPGPQTCGKPMTNRAPEGLLRALLGSVASVETKIKQAWSMRRRCRRVPALRSSFAGFRFPPDVITLAVRWYLCYGLSYRDLEELMAERASPSITSPSTAGCSASHPC
jgi:hypothetical protein